MAEMANLRARVIRSPSEGGSAKRRDSSIVLPAHRRGHRFRKRIATSWKGELGEDDSYRSPPRRTSYSRCWLARPLPLVALRQPRTHSFSLTSSSPSRIASSSSSLGPKLPAEMPSRSSSFSPSVSPSFSFSSASSRFSSSPPREPTDRSTSSNDDPLLLVVETVGDEGSVAAGSGSESAVVTWGEAGAGAGAGVGAEDVGAAGWEGPRGREECSAMKDEMWAKYCGWTQVSSVVGDKSVTASQRLRGSRAHHTGK